ncbi:MAG: glutamyl-tRNA reductase [Elusimicrobia bacterium]|nr:glutamyl-tRNA reductase [Elusimicrobiota bacterium]
MQNRHIVEVGINHLKASVPLRERLAVLPKESEAALEQVLESAGAQEAVLLSTCSRLEAYVVAKDPVQAEAGLKAWFAGRAAAEVLPALESRRGIDAIAHLFRVACGLDSWIIGESEILGQVRKAYEFSLERRHTGSMLNRLFQRAVAAGKKVRTETSIQAGIHSIGGAAAVLARKIFQSEQRGSIIVFGAGEVAESVVRHLAAKNFDKIWVANRTLERAKALAAPLGAQALSLEAGLARLSEAEIAIFSLQTSAPFLSASEVSQRIATRGRPLFLIDLGVPRNVEASCMDLSNVYLYDLDQLKAVVAENMTRKAADKEKAEILARQLTMECDEELKRSEALRLARLEEAVR